MNPTMSNARVVSTAPGLVPPAPEVATGPPEVAPGPPEVAPGPPEVPPVTEEEVTSEVSSGPPEVTDEEEQEFVTASKAEAKMESKLEEKMSEITKLLGIMAQQQQMLHHQEKPHGEMTMTFYYTKPP